MVKGADLSSDIDFIKEIEELKLKQKLLISSLKKKGETEETKLFLEINSKLDFLVKIFNEANQKDEEDEDEETSLKDMIVSIESKVDTLSEKMSKKFKDLDNLSVKEEDSKDESIKKSDVDEKSEKQISSDEGKKDDSVKEESLPPAPDFGMNEGQEVNDSKKKKEVVLG